MKIRIELVKEGEFYRADILGFPTIHTKGRTPTEAKRNAVQAVRVYLDAVRKATPRHHGRGETVRVVDAIV